MSLSALALLAAMSVSDGPSEDRTDIYQQLIVSYTEVLLVGHACQPYGATAHPYVVEQTINDLVELGLSETEAKEMVDGIISAEGSKTQLIVKEEAALNEHAAVFYCTVGYKEKLETLNALRSKVGLQ